MTPETWISLGYPIFPVKRGAKTPLTPNGFKDATTDPEALIKWKIQFPGCSWGLPTGPASGVWVLDVDNKENKDGLSTLRSLQETHGALETFTVATPSGGLHLYFTWDAGAAPIKNSVNAVPGLDVRGDGGYVVIPPSEGYTVSVDMGQSSAPEWLLTGLRASTTLAVGDRPGLGSDDTSVGEGGRNNYLTRVAGRLRRSGLSFEAMMEALRIENDVKCVPPLPEQELHTIGLSISRYQPGDPVAVRESVAGGGVEDVGSSSPLYLKIGDLLARSREFLLDKDRIRGQATGIESIDALLGGGKRLGELTVWHAEAKSGKNTLWHYKMWLWLNQGIPLGYASRELSPETEVVPALLSLEAGRNLLRAQSIDGSHWEKALAWPLYFSNGYGVMPWPEVRRWVTSLHSVGVRYFFFDHLHYLLEHSEDYTEASEFSRKMKALTKELNIHIDLIVQPTKVMEGQIMGKNTLRGGAGIGQALDNLFVMSRVVDNGRKTDVTKVSLVDKRFLLAKEGSVHLEYDQETLRFHEAVFVPDEIGRNADEGSADFSSGRFTNRPF